LNEPHEAWVVIEMPDQQEERQIQERIEICLRLRRLKVKAHAILQECEWDVQMVIQQIPIRVSTEIDAVQAASGKKKHKQEHPDERRPLQDTRKYCRTNGARFG
jgi:hypothetical protein